MSTAEVINFPVGGKKVADLDDGYTRIANDLYDALIAADLTKHQQKVAHAYVRMTYGYNKKNDRIADSQIAAKAKLPRCKVNVAKQELLAMNVLIQVGKNIGINKNISEWNINKSYQNSNNLQNGNSVTKTVTKSVTETVTMLLPKTEHTKDIISKDNKDNTPISPKGENLAQELLNYYNQSRNARCQDFSPFIKALNKYSLDEIKLVIDWFDATGKSKAKPQSICRFTRFDGYLSDAITWHGSQKNYKAVIELFNDICGEKLGFVDEITPKRIEKIDNIIKAVSKKNSDVLAAIGRYFEILMDISTDLDICNPRTNWTMNFDNIMTVEKLDNTRSKFMKLQGEHQ